MNVLAKNFFRCLNYTSIVAVFSLLSINMVYAQQTEPCYAGVFISRDDFLSNKLSHPINTSAQGYKLDFSFPADLTLALKIITPDTTIKFAPGSIYGYSECGRLFRYFSGGKELNAQEDFYKVEEAGDDLVIYSSVFVSGNEIFYSMSLTSDIHRLTLSNLKKDFHDEPEFLEEAKKLKRQPDGLASRDDSGFRIMQLYRDIVGDKD